MFVAHNLYSMIVNLATVLATLRQAGLTLYAQMDPSFWIDTMNLGQSIVYNERSQVIISK